MPARNDPWPRGWQDVLWRLIANRTMRLCLVGSMVALAAAPFLGVPAALGWISFIITLFLVEPLVYRQAPDLIGPAGLL